MSLTMPIIAVAIPEILILTMTCFTLLVDAFAPVRFRASTYYLAQLTLVMALLWSGYQWMQYPDAVVTFGGHYVLDRLALLSKMTIYVFSLFAFAYARDYIQARQIARSDYYLLALLSVLGMSVMVSANNLLTIYLGLELLSLPLYAMIAIHKTSEPAIESAMKYFVLGSFASGLFLYGVSLLYGATGSIQPEVIAASLQNHSQVAVLVALVFIVSGLLFKLGAVPFHMWVPDVYQGAPTATTLFLAAAPKMAAFAVFIRILMVAMPSLNIEWEKILIVASILSMSIGNLLAIAQTNLKRMFAYSSIAHVGYALLGIIAATNSTDGYAAAVFYMITYVLVAAGGFAIISLVSCDGVDLDELEDYRGLNTRNPWLAFMMLLILFSMAGVPPTVGFFAKLGLLESLVQAHFIWLAGLALLFALIGAYYYLRVVMLMYFDEPKDHVAHTIVISPRMMAVISLNGSAALILGMFPSTLIDICRVTFMA